MYKKIIIVFVVLILFQSGCSKKSAVVSSKDDLKQGQNFDTFYSEEFFGDATPFDYIGSVWKSNNPDIKLEVISDDKAKVTLFYEDEETEFLLEPAVNVGNDFSFFLADYGQQKDKKIFMIKTKEKEMLWYGFCEIKSNRVENELTYKRYAEILFIRQK